jgi:predicted RND superfamily exporter protein
MISVPFLPTEDESPREFDAAPSFRCEEANSYSYDIPRIRYPPPPALHLVPGRPPVLGFLPRFSALRPLIATLLVLALPLVAGPGLQRLTLRTDGNALVPDSPAAITAERLREEFGFHDPVVLLLRSSHESGVYCPEALRALADLTARANGLLGPESDAAVSLATETGDRFQPGTLRFRRLLDPIPETPAAIAELRSDLAALEVYDGTLVSRDGSAAAVLLPVPSGVDRVSFLGRAGDVARATLTDSLRVDVIGAPVAEALLGSHLLADLSRLIPITLALMALVFALCFRNALAVALPLVEIGACLAFVLGAAGWLGAPIYLTTAVLPVILSMIAVADEIHLFARFAQLRRQDVDLSATAAAASTMKEMKAPLVKTSLTTAIGFLSFAISPLAPVRAFGVMAAAGILYCLLFSLIVVPAALAQFGGGAIRAPFEGISRLADAHPLGGKQAPAGVGRRRLLTWAAAGLILVAGVGGVQRLRVQDSWIDGFAKESAFRRASEFFDEQFLGSHLLRFVMRTDPVRLAGKVPGRTVGDHEVRVDPANMGDPATLRGCRFTIGRDSIPEGAGRIRSMPNALRNWTAAVDSVRIEAGEAVIALPPGRGSPRLLLGPRDDELLDWSIESRRFADPRFLGETERFEEFLAAQRERSVGGVLGPATFLRTTNFIVRRRGEGSRVIPDTPYDIDRLWSNYARIRGVDELNELITTDRSAGVVTAYLRHANFVDTAALIDTVRAYERDHLAPAGIRVELGGDIAVSQTLITAIVDTQVRSLLLSLIGVLAVASWLNRSLRWGLLCVLPCAFAVFAVFAGMGWSGMPLGVATSMFAGMCLGIGVDFAIHFVDRFRRERTGGEVSPHVALRNTASVAGPPVLVDALVVTIGFGAMTMSAVPLNARLGVITAITVAAALVATLVLLPSLLPAGRDLE